MRPGQVRAAALHHPAHRAPPRYPPIAVCALACPHCSGELAVADGAFACGRGHSFDIARQGYVALLGARARTDTADSADMVLARVDYLGAGHYAPISTAVARAVGRASDGERAFQPPRTVPPLVLEIGAGTGYYLRAAVDEAGPDGAGIALDSSKFAARRAATDPRVLSVVADAWSVLPIRSGSVDAVLSIFAPRDAAEISRVLAPGGVLVAVTPEPSHLRQLRTRLSMLTVDEGKADRLAEGLAGQLERTGRELVEFDMTLTNADVCVLVRMGPSARHLTAADLADQVGALSSPTTVTASVMISVFSAPDGTAVPRPG